MPKAYLVRFTFCLPHSWYLQCLRGAGGEGAKQNKKKTQTNKNFYSCHLKYETDILFKDNQPDKLVKMAQ